MHDDGLIAKPPICQNYQHVDNVCASDVTPCCLHVPSMHFAYANMVLASSSCQFGKCLYEDNITTPNLMAWQHCL